MGESILDGLPFWSQASFVGPVSKTVSILTAQDSLAHWHSLHGLNSWGRRKCFWFRLWGWLYACKNWQVKNCWGIEKENVCGDCKDGFVNKHGGIERWKLAEVEENIFDGDCGGGCMHK